MESCTAFSSTANSFALEIHLLNQLALFSTRELGGKFKLSHRATSGTKDLGCPNPTASPTNSKSVHGTPQTCRQKTSASLKAPPFWRGLCTRRDPAGTSKRHNGWDTNPNATPNLGGGEGMANRQNARTLGNQRSEAACCKTKAGDADASSRLSGGKSRPWSLHRLRMT